MKRLREKVKKKLKEAVAPPPPPRKTKKKKKKKKPKSSSAPKRESRSKKNVAEQPSVAESSSGTSDGHEPIRKEYMQARVSDVSEEEPVPVKEEAPKHESLESEAAALSGGAKSRGAYWHIALSRLKTEEKQTLKELLKPSTSLEPDDHGPVLEEAEGSLGFDLNSLDPFRIAALAAEKVKRLDDKAWKFRFRGRDIILRDLANKITSWLGKFKEVGDIAVNYDPVHAAVPWAAIRFLLQAATAEQELAGHMLVGTERISYLLARCQVYRKLYLNEETEKPILSHGQLEESLISLYTEILSLLAHLIGLTNRSLVRRGLHALFNPSKLSEMIARLEKLDTRIEADASNCERETRSISDKVWRRRYDALHHLLNQQILLSEEERERFLDNCKSNERFEILRWISDIPYEADHYNASIGRTKGTGEWLLVDPIYRDWRTTSASVCLWLHGKPGAGKTKLSTKVVDDLLGTNTNQISDEGMAYFYCDRNRKNYRDPVWVMRSFVRQLSASQQHTTIAKCVRDKYIGMKQKGFASDLTHEDCTSLLLQLVNILPQTTLVLDGLDECDKDTRHTLMDALDDIMHKAEHPVKIFIASREHEDLADRYSDRDHLKVSASRNQGDIEKFVWQRMQESRYCRTQMQPAVRDQVFKTFREKSDGMFQWAALHIKELLELERDHDILRYLDDLPVGLKAAYDKIYNGIESQRGSKSEIAINAMKWVVCANRPLSPSELVIAACQDPDQDLNENIDVQPIYLLNACHNLIEVYDAEEGVPRFVTDEEATLIQRTLYPNARNDKSSAQPPKNKPGDLNETDITFTGDRVYCRFSHLSIVEYLLAHKWEMADLHAFAARICLRTLLRFSLLDQISNHVGFPTPVDSQVSSCWPLSRSYPRIELVARWSFSKLPKHQKAALIYESTSLKSIIKKAKRRDFEQLLSQSPQTWLLYAVTEWFNHAHHLMTVPERTASQRTVYDLLSRFLGHPDHGSVWYMAWVVLFKVLQFRQHFARRWDPKILGLQRFHPASWCAAIGFSVVLNNWIEEGILDANFASDASDLLNPLWPKEPWSNAKSSNSGYYLYSLLHTAVRNGQFKVAEMLISRGAKDHGAGPWESALEVAIRLNREDIAKLFLDRMTDIRQDYSQRPVLQAASNLSWMNLEIIHLLIQKRADIGERIDFYHIFGKLTAFEISCLHPYRELTTCYLTSVLPGIDAHHPMALRLAAMTNKAQLVYQLVFMGADVNAPLAFDFHGDSDIFRMWETPLITAVRQYCTRGYYKTLDFSAFGARALLENGADPNVLSEDGLTPLQMAVTEMHHELIVILVWYGADLTVKFNDGTTILQMACRHGNASVVRFLTSNGANVNEVSGPWRTPLFAAHLNATSDKPYRKRIHEWLDDESEYEDSETSEEYWDSRSETGSEDYTDENSETSERSQDEASDRSHRPSLESHSGRVADPRGEHHSNSGGGPEMSDRKSRSNSSVSSVAMSKPQTPGSFYSNSMVASGWMQRRLKMMLTSAQPTKSLPSEEEPGAVVLLLMKLGAEFAEEDYEELDETEKQEVDLMKVLVQGYMELLSETQPKVRELKDRFEMPPRWEFWALAQRVFVGRPDGKVMIRFEQGISRREPHPYQI